MPCEGQTFFYCLLARGNTPSPDISPTRQQDTTIRQSPKRKRLEKHFLKNSYQDAFPCIRPTGIIPLPQTHHRKEKNDPDDFRKPSGSFYKIIMMFFHFIRRAPKQKKRSLRERLETKKAGNKFLLFIFCND